MSKFYKVEDAVKGSPDYLFFCEGCKCDHGIWVNTHPNGSNWIFNNDVDHPTVSPSILITYPSFRNKDENGVGIAGTEYIHTCHSFITNGMIQFLSDCTHDFKNKTVDLIDY